MWLADSVEQGILQGLASKCNFDVRQLVQYLGVSQRQLQRLFRAELNCSPQAWLRERRLQTARHMLQSAHAVKQVAYTLAFPSESQFSRDFKARFGHSPSNDLSSRCPAPDSTGVSTGAELHSCKRLGVGG
jgi:transcriptional regulator GlxA family with amidase domain